MFEHVVIELGKKSVKADKLQCKREILVEVVVDVKYAFFF